MNTQASGVEETARRYTPCDREDRGCTSESIAARLWRNRRLHLLSSTSFTGNSSGLKINQRYRLHRSPPRLPLWPFSASSMAGNLTALPLYGRPLYCAGARMRVCECVRARPESSEAAGRGFFLQFRPSVLNSGTIWTTCGALSKGGTLLISSSEI